MKNRDEAGMYLVLVALSAVALLAVVSLAVDSALMHTSKLRWQQFADSACLATLESYLLEVERGIPAAEARERASARARSIFADNILGASFTTDLAKTPQDKFAHDGLGSPADSGENGLIMFGRWLEAPGTGESSDAGGASGCPDQRYPCFLRLSEEQDVVSSISLQLHVADRHQIPTVLATLAGIDAYKVEVESICSVEPRFINVAIDLSRSAVYQTHRGLTEFVPQGSSIDLDLDIPVALQSGLGPFSLSLNYGEFARRGILLPQLSGMNPCAQLPIPLQKGLPFNPLCEVSWQPDASCPNVSCDQSSPNCPHTLYDCPAWVAPQTRMSYSLLEHARSGDPHPEKHYRDDYTMLMNRFAVCPTYTALRDCLRQCRSVLRSQGTPEEVWAKYQQDCILGSGTSICGTASNVCRNHEFHFPLIDTYTDISSASGEGPRKFGPQPYFSFLSGVHTLVEIFEGRSVAEDRLGLFGFSSNTFLPLANLPLDRTSGAVFKRIKYLTDTQAMQIEVATAGGRAGYLDNSAIFKSLVAQQLIPFGSSSFDDSNIDLALRHALMMFEEVPDAPASHQREVIVFTDGLVSCFPSQGTSQGGAYRSTCTPSYDTYRNGMNSIEQTVLEYYKEQNVKLHVILAGASVQPHMLLYSDGNKCLIGDEAVERGAPTLVDANCESGPCTQEDFERSKFLDGAQFRDPNRMQEFVQTTGGRWLALLPNCRIEGLAGRLENLCGAVNGSGLQVVKGDIQSAAYLDAKGRLLCDPFNRDTGDQVTDFMKEIMSSNTIRLVGPQ